MRCSGSVSPMRDATVRASGAQQQHTHSFGAARPHPSLAVPFQSFEPHSHRCVTACAAKTPNNGGRRRGGVVGSSNDAAPIVAAAQQHWRCGDLFIAEATREPWPRSGERRRGKGSSRANMGSRGSSNTSSRWRPLRRRPHSYHHNSRLWDGAAGGAASATFQLGWSRYAHGLGGGESTDWGHPFTYSATFNHSNSIESQEQRGRLADPPQGPAQPRRDVSRMQQRCVRVCAAVVRNKSIGNGPKLTSYNSPVT